MTGLQKKFHFFVAHAGFSQWTLAQIHLQLLLPTSSYLLCPKAVAIYSFLPAQLPFPPVEFHLTVQGLSQISSPLGRWNVVYSSPAFFLTSCFDEWMRPHIHRAPIWLASHSLHYPLWGMKLLVILSGMPCLSSRNIMPVSVTEEDHSRYRWHSKQYILSWQRPLNTFQELYHVQVFDRLF